MGDGYTEQALPIIRRVEGMTLRDWFAGMALISLVHRREMTATETYARSELALEAYHYAHAMLEARKITQ